LPYNGDNQFSIIYLSALIISLIITSIIIAIQLRKNLKGTKINIKKSTIFLIYYILIVSYLIYNSFSTGVPLTYLLPYVMIIILSGYYSYWYSKRNLLFWRDNDNNLYAKGGLLIYLIYITALVVRIVINLVFIGYQEVNFTESGNIVIINHPLVHMSFKSRIISLIVTDLLITIGTGMLIGRYARVMEHFTSKIKTE
jgi:hypothetical protein